MIKATIEISKEANDIINVIKALKNLKTKSEAINYIITQFGYDMLEPELNPEFVKEMME